MRMSDSLDCGCETATVAGDPPTRRAVTLYSAGNLRSNGEAASPNIPAFRED
jgi:hypothetical protein